MEEELTRAINRRADKNQPAGSAPGSTQPMLIKTRIFGSNDAKRMSFDENMPMSQYGASPLSSLLSNSPGSAYSSGAPNMGNQGRRDSLKNLWHLQDFGTD